MPLSQYKVTLYFNQTKGALYFYLTNQKKKLVSSIEQQDTKDSWKLLPCICHENGSLTCIWAEISNWKWREPKISAKGDEQIWWNCHICNNVFIDQGLAFELQPLRWSERSTYPWQNFMLVLKKAPCIHTWEKTKGRWGKDKRELEHPEDGTEEMQKRTEEEM